MLPVISFLKRRNFRNGEQINGWWRVKLCVGEKEDLMGEQYLYRRTTSKILVVIDYGGR